MGPGPIVFCKRVLEVKHWSHLGKKVGARASYSMPIAGPEGLSKPSRVLVRATREEKAQICLSELEEVAVTQVS